jgi:hypothetical protein
MMNYDKTGAGFSLRLMDYFDSIEIAAPFKARITIYSLTLDYHNQSSDLAQNHKELKS